MVVDIGLSIFGLAICAGAYFLLSARADKRNDTPEPRLVPWRLLSFAPVIFALLIVAHLMGLAGLETGPGKSPFRF